MTVKFEIFHTVWGWLNFKTEETKRRHFLVTALVENKKSLEAHKMVAWFSKYSGWAQLKPYENQKGWKGLDPSYWNR